jgi:hypothetical protein
MDDLRALIEAIEEAKPRPSLSGDELDYQICLHIEWFADSLVAALRAKLAEEDTHS